MTTTTNKTKTFSPFLPWFIWGLAALFYAYEFFLQVSPSVMVSDLMSAFNINAAQLGNLAAFYFYAYLLMQIPAGMFLDTLGPRKLLTISCAVCMSGAFIFGSAHQLWQAEIGRLLIGFGSSFAVIGTFKLATIWFPANRFALVVGLTVMIGMFGAVIGGAPLAMVVKAIGWRPSMLMLAGFGLALSFFIWTVVRDTPPCFAEKKGPAEHAQKSILQSLFHVFKQKQNWLIAIYGGLMFAPTSAFAGLWGVSFIMTKYGVPRGVAAATVSMIFIGWIVGSPFWGWFSDHIFRRKPPMFIGTLFAFIAMTLVIYVQMSTFLLSLSLFCFGFFSAGFLPAFSMIREINPTNTSATTMGFMNMMNMVGGTVLQPMIGWILDKYWQGQMLSGARVFSLHAYSMAMLTLPCILFLSLFLLPFIQETYCQQSTAKI